MLIGTVIATAKAEKVSCVTKLLGGIFAFRQVPAANCLVTWFLRYARLILWS